MVAPPSLEEAKAELFRCLRLTVPVGMTDQDRLEWLLVAYDEIKDVPSCEFADRCSHARKIADHPAKIVPAIHAFKPVSYASAAWYRERLATLRKQWENRFAPRLEQKDVTDGERENVARGMAELLRELKARELGRFEPDEGDAA